MPKIKLHTNDMPKSAVKKTKLPTTLLGHVREAVYPSPAGKPQSIEDIWLRQHFEAMLAGNRAALYWLLDKIIKDKKAELDAAPERPQWTVDGVHYYQPLAPVVSILKLGTVTEAPEGSKESQRIELAPEFLAELERRCSADKLKAVRAWSDAGGLQKPRIRDRDQWD